MRQKHTAPFAAKMQTTPGVPSGDACAAGASNSFQLYRTNHRRRAAHYCDRNCQVSDYQARHKDECVNFVHPPTTDGFLTKPIAGERYPPQPVFAHSHSDSVGCWVTVEGCIDCKCVELTT